jgi:hypothetical protein
MTTEKGIRLVGGWVGAAIKLEELEDHVSRRHARMLESLNRYVMCATDPATPEAEQRAYLDAAVRFAREIHKQRETDRALVHLAHMDVMTEAEKAGATEQARFQERVLSFNVRMSDDIEYRAMARARGLKECDPATRQASLSESTGGEEK